MSADLKLLAARATKGDRAAFRGIVLHTQDRLYRLSARMMGSTADAEDVLQEAYLKAYRALSDGRYDGRSNISTWLYRIVANAAVDGLRRRKSRPTDQPVNSELARYDGNVSMEARLALQELDEWLSELPPEQRAVVVLKTVEGLTSAEVAKALDCSEGAVEQRLVRARATLRDRRARDER